MSFSMGILKVSICSIVLRDIQKPVYCSAKIISAESRVGL